MHVAHNQNETLLHRHPKNPILTAADWPYGINTVFNAGATLLPDGTTLFGQPADHREPDCSHNHEGGLGGASGPR
jgi:hypothetical protein